MTDFRFETCDHCHGSGVETFGCWVYEHGCGFPHRDIEERPCSKCSGNGECEFEVEPITLDDLT